MTELNEKSDNPRYLTVVTRVCPTDSWRILTSLTRGFKLVCANPGSGGCVASQGLEVKSWKTGQNMMNKKLAFFAFWNQPFMNR